VNTTTVGGRGTSWSDKTRGAAPVRAETTTPVSHRNTGRDCGRLLVVDDDPEVRGLLVRLLESEGYQVEEASTGAEATTALSGRSPDLVILDVMLTTEDGFDVLAAIRRTSNVPVILV